MRKTFRLTCVILSLFVFQMYTAPCFAAGEGATPGASTAGEAKITTNDPQFIPLTEEKEIKKGIAWYWWVLGAAVIAGAAAAAAGGGGGGGGSTTTTAPTGSVTGSW